jgi:EcsC protein family
MSSTTSSTTLSLADQKILWAAVRTLERESLVARVSELTGEPVTQLLRHMPGMVSRQIHRVVHRALAQALEAALYKWDSRFPEPGVVGFRVMSGITGGVSGFFGLATLAVELPVTTTLMLRSIAGIARREGEDLTQTSARLACLEVFALGPRTRGHMPIAETSYYATRAFLAKAVSESARLFAERGIAQRSSPVIVELLTALGSRFGLVVSEKVAAGAIPVVGAIGGAAVNLAFMEHFQKLAHAHFTVRRLERQYGPAEVHRIYEAYAYMVAKRASMKAG